MLLMYADGFTLSNSTCIVVVVVGVTVHEVPMSQQKSRVVHINSILDTNVKCVVESMN